MIKSIKKVQDGKYILNDCVYVSEIDVEDDRLGCNIGFDPAMTNEKEATEIANQFLTEAIENLSKNL